MLQHVAHMFITDWETLETVALQQLFDQTGTKMSTVGELLLKLPTTTSVKMKKREEQPRVNSTVSFCSSTGCCSVAAVDQAVAWRCEANAG